LGYRLGFRVGPQGATGEFSKLNQILSVNRPRLRDFGAAHVLPAHRRQSRNSARVFGFLRWNLSVIMRTIFSDFGLLGKVDVLRATGT
jgi:hypothetical protein